MNSFPLGGQSELQTINFHLRNELDRVLFFFGKGDGAGQLLALQPVGHQISGRLGHSAARLPVAHHRQRVRPADSRRASHSIASGDSSSLDSSLDLAFDAVQFDMGAYFFWVSIVNPQFLFAVNCVGLDCFHGIATFKGNLSIIEITLVLKSIACLTFLSSNNPPLSIVFQSNQNQSFAETEAVPRHAGPFWLVSCFHFETAGLHRVAQLQPADSAAAPAGGGGRSLPRPNATDAARVPGRAQRPEQRLAARRTRQRFQRQGATSVHLIRSGFTAFPPPFFLLSFPRVCLCYRRFYSFFSFNFLLVVQ